MATIGTDANGNRRILFVAADKKRKTIRLGKVTKKVAETMKLRVEHLVSLSITRSPMDAELSQWLDTIGDGLAAKLAAVGLTPGRQKRTLSTFLDDYIRGRENDRTTKPTTLITIRRVSDDLRATLGEGTDLRAIGVEQAEQFKQGYQDQGLAPATIYRRLKMAKMLFKHAAKLKLISENPFEDVKAKNHIDNCRSVYITVDDALKMIAVAKPFWRTLISLCRFAGLRNPTETLSLRWDGIDFAVGRMTVHSPKTEHHEGGASRVVPIFAQLRPYLEEAQQGCTSEYVLHGPIADRERTRATGPRGWQSNNLRTTMLQIVKRAGLAPWPKLFHNLRASCETDLMQSHPIHVVTAWIGNTPKIALGHYLQTLDTDFAKAIEGTGTESGTVAAQNPAQSEAVYAGQERTLRLYCPGNEANCPPLSPTDRNCTSEQMAKVGLEPPRVIPIDSRVIRQSSAPSGTESGTVHPPELRLVIDSWESLPDGIRQAITSLVKAASASTKKAS